MGAKIRLSHVLTRRVAAGCLMLGLCALLLPGLGSAGLGEARAEEKKAGKKVSVSPGFSQVVLATQLALQGQKRKSAVMMLAAAELVRDLKESERKSSGSLVGKGGEASESKTVELSVAQLVDKAKQYAKSNKTLRALVKARGEQLLSRGIDPAVGERLKTVTIKDKNYKVLGGGKVVSYGSATIENVPFVANKIAMVAAVGQNSMESLVVEVHRKDGSLVQNPPDWKANFMTAWFPTQAESYDVMVKNNGPEQVVVLLANWD